MAVMQGLKPRVSYTDLLQQPDDGRRYELYDGEVVVIPSPLPIHQFVAKNILQSLDAYAKTRGGLVLDSPLDIVFSEFDVVMPDVVYFSAARRSKISLRAPIRIGPDLAVEVLSPSTARIDRGRKREMFIRYRVPEYWIVDPATETVEVYTLADDEYRLALRAGRPDEICSVALPDFRMPAASIFTYL